MKSTGQWSTLANKRTRPPAETRYWVVNSFRSVRTKKRINELKYWFSFFWQNVETNKRTEILIFVFLSKRKNGLFSGFCLRQLFPENRVIKRTLLHLYGQRMGMMSHVLYLYRLKVSEKHYFSVLCHGLIWYTWLYHTVHCLQGTSVDELMMKKYLSIKLAVGSNGPFMSVCTDSLGEFLFFLSIRIPISNTPEWELVFLGSEK